MNLFQKVDIILNSGQKSDFKIECDALTNSDIECFAHLISKRVKFSKIVGVPRGGVRIEDALKQYSTNDPNDPIIIVDDVLTTGGSMERYKKMYEDWGYTNIVGIVLFARGKCPSWIESVFQMW